MRNDQPRSNPVAEGDEILEAVVPAGDRSRAIEAEPLTARQRVGLWIAGVVGLFMLVVSSFAAVDMLTHAPQPPVLAVGTSPAVHAQLIANYRALADATRAGPMALIDVLVLKMLSPVLTLAIGYALGEARKAE